MLTSMLLALALGTGLTASATATALEQADSTRPDVLAEVRVQGNLLTPDDEVRRLAGLEIGMAVTPDTPADVASRLRAAGRFKRVDVLKRFASIADPTQIVIVVILDEGPVRIDTSGGPGTPARVVRRGGLRLMYLPVLSFEDGYGFSYGVRVARTGPLGRRSRVAFPLTWGGDKRAGVEVDKTFLGGPLTRVEAGAAVSRRRHPFYGEDDDRRRTWVTAERVLTRSLQTSATVGWQHVALLDRPAGDAGFLQTGAALVFDTRLDPVLARNAVYARTGWDRSFLPGASGGPINQTILDARGYVGLPGQSVLVVRAVREDADGTAPPYLKSMLGGMPNLRGFKRGVAVGDTLVAGSVEVRVPLSSPLSLGKLGVSAFMDVGTAYDHGQRFGDQKLERGIGGGVWFSMAFVRLNLAVAHGVGGTTRVHVGTTLSP
jgi:outer membrane translocation and assembly module TamA